MPKNVFTKREHLICGKLDELCEMVTDQQPPVTMLLLIDDIRRDATRMELKLISRKTEVEELCMGEFDE